MERLTEKGNYSTYIRKNHVTVNDVEQRLGEYEDLEEQGLLLKLPCKIGNAVYEVIDYLDCKYDYNCPLSFSQGAYDCENGLHCRHEYKKYFVNEAKFNHHMIDKIGETVFLTKEEAEQKLKELEN